MLAERAGGYEPLAPAPRYDALAAWASQAASEDCPDAPAFQAAAELSPSEAHTEKPDDDALLAQEPEPKPAQDADPPPAAASDRPHMADGSAHDDERADGAPASDLAGELQAAEEVAVEEVTAVLSGVLDRLGAAHHRPFSRA